MTDIDKIYECIIDKTYQNKSQLEIILSEIEDRELVIGFIFDMLLKHSAYEIDKQSMLELMAETLGEMTPRDFIKNCHSGFIKKIDKINKDSLSVNSFVVEALMMLCDHVDEDGKFIGTTFEFEKLLRSCDSKAKLAKLKENLLEGELYEFIGLVDKYLL